MRMLYYHWHLVQHYKRSYLEVTSIYSKTLFVTHSIGIRKGSGNVLLHVSTHWLRKKINLKYHWNMVGSTRDRQDALGTSENFLCRVSSCIKDEVMMKGYRNRSQRHSLECLSIGHIEQVSRREWEGYSFTLWTCAYFWASGYILRR